MLVYPRWKRQSDFHGIITLLGASGSLKCRPCGPCLPVASDARQPDNRDMRIDIVTLFPEMFEGYFQASILERAQQAQLLSLHVHQLREYASGKHRVTDEPPYGGGGGMILKPEPIFRAIENILRDEQKSESGVNVTEHKPPIILMTPQGRPFTHAVAEELAGMARLVLLCGRYEGVDERVRQHLVTDELSIGDYVLTGGELGAMVVVDAVARLIPGVLGAEDAADEDSFASGLLEGPHYTRPAVFRSWSVPDVLRSGHAAHIQEWRRQQALRRTWERRPELLLSATLRAEEKQFLAVLAEESVNLRGDPGK